MSSLQLSLDDTNFEHLVELGRSMLPEYAPRWTDHNVHDPGIMLIELLAWVADQQICSMSVWDAAPAHAGVVRHRDNAGDDPAWRVDCYSRRQRARDRRGQKRETVCKGRIASGIQALRHCRQWGRSNCARRHWTVSCSGESGSRLATPGV
jgi:hypothetical protein